MPAPQEQRDLDAKSRLIVALDVDSASKARSLMDELGSSVGAFKIGLQLFTSAGPVLVRSAAEAGHRIFLDLKFHDIPNTVAMAAVEAAKLGVWMFNVHALGGGEMMKRTFFEVAETCERENLSRPKIIAVTILTSSDANDLNRIGIEQDVESTVANLARLAARSGLDGVVASAREAERIKRDAGTQDFIVVTPGIRPTSATSDDQKRVMTPTDALRSGSDYLVVGRPITDSKDRLNAVDAILGEMNAALEIN